MDSYCLVEECWTQQEIEERGESLREFYYDPEIPEDGYLIEGCWTRREWTESWIEYKISEMRKREDEREIMRKIGFLKNIGFFREWLFKKEWLLKWL